MAIIVLDDRRGATAPLLQLDYEEALSLLALLNVNAAYWNKNLRATLVTYIEKLPAK